MLAGRAGAQRFIVICTVPVPRDFSRMREKCVRKASLSNKTMRVLRPLGRKHLAAHVQTALPRGPGKLSVSSLGASLQHEMCALILSTLAVSAEASPAARGLSLAELGALATLL